MNEPSTIATTPKTIGQRVDLLIERIEQQPLVAVGIGVAVGYLLARLVKR